VKLEPTYSEDIRPLFREQDVLAMDFAFDLSAYEAVRANAQAIYERLVDGSMPCDAPWPSDHVALFRRWIDAGARE
jgi:hypothetical protein